MQGLNYDQDTVVIAVMVLDARRLRNCCSTQHSMSSAGT
ncbi:MAG: hypothetical protein AVDCRST_MAG75-1441 [uncultured Propionibacteriaceae bacterium]|uniref:Uncharacterized protein n=1 Tax=uncultured Propionibacteriaceae bacterium TaxID=257457 RepID=A0A6J4NI78_9ACTN|nr:MAG: hypothetical protein AVDCRST_MAG75-1441 [uncultured Propionibacteriaceae bacterium]